MSKIPRPLLVFIVLALGTLVIYTFQAPHTPCDSQKDVFVALELGTLFPKPAPEGSHTTQYLRFRESCRNGSTPGACFEYFGVLQKIIQDLGPVSSSCSEQFQSLPELQRALTDSIEIFATLAWGQEPPEPNTDVKGILSVADISRFCRVKNLYRRFWGEDPLNDLQLKIFSVLPGEPLQINDKHECTNCDNRKMAPSVLSTEEIWGRSIFSIPCEKYQ